MHPQINQEIMSTFHSSPSKKPPKKPTITSALISTSSSSPQQITDLTLVLLLVLIALLPTLLVIYMPLISLIYEYERSTTTKFKLGGGKRVKKLYIIMYPCICIISHGNKSTSTHKAHTYMKRQDRTLPTLLAGALTLTSSPRGKSRAS